MPHYLLNVVHGESGPYATENEKERAWADTATVACGGAVEVRSFH